MTVHFVEYLPSGQIVLSGTSAMDAVAVALVPALRGGVVVEIPEPVILPPYAYWTGTAVAQMPAPPSPAHRVDWVSKTWVDLRTLDEHKAAKWASIKSAREGAEFGPFTWDGSVFDANVTSQQRIAGAVQMASLSASFSVNWTLNDNTVRLLSNSQMIAVGTALAYNVSILHQKSRSLREKIDAATSVAEVDAIAWF